MIADLIPLLPFSQNALWGFFLVFLRIGSMVSFLPAFGEQTVPVRVRLGITLAFCLIIFPAVSDRTTAAPDTLMSGLAIGGPEIATGLFFGLLLRFFVIALQTAGAIAAQSTSLSQIFGGTAGADPQPAIGHVLVVAGLALAAMMGLHVQFAAYMIQSYNLVPLGAVVESETVSALGVAAVSRTFALGFTLAAPFVLASLIYNVTLGVINKAMPQLMVSFVGAPAITAGGLFLLLITAPFILSIWVDTFMAFVMNPSGGF
ncbi:flagellar biosynthetic protein FliR [Cognatiyoonia koreensis]|uniref:Flagellar biosynthetic protein FliR n=1 Tax=Cognatiyoonia koreensis TaxID=364200 RepID=A0A1I0RKH6_9RHOB|nr:flagellar biosynthetic protein FliR [Cognatiyoonia koreensis]SEW41315.1 flagellar biosynthetic protein FliR [Cognatiyoonia koreensis]